MRLLSPTGRIIVFDVDASLYGERREALRTPSLRYAILCTLTNMSHVEGGAAVELKDKDLGNLRLRSDKSLDQIICSLSCSRAQVLIPTDRRSVLDTQLYRVT